MKKGPGRGGASTRRPRGGAAGAGTRRSRSATLEARPRSAKRGAGKPKTAGRVKKRSKGRPHDPESVVGRDALVRAARELLRTVPPGKITRLDIAQHAGVDPALIRYYFGDKSRLMGEVVLAMLTDMRAVREKRAAGTGAANRLRSRLADSVRLFQEHPHHYSLVLEQIFTGAEPKLRAMWRRDIVQPGVVELTSIIEEGIKKGELRRVDPRFLHLLVIAAGEFYATGRAVLDDLFGPQAVDAKLERDYVDFLFDLFMYGMAKRPAASPSGR